MISLLLNIHPDSGHETRLAAAIALIKGQGGHITCIQVLPPPLTPGDPASVVTEAEVLEVLEQTAQEFQELVEVKLEAADVQWTWLRLYGDAASTIVRQSRLSDAILLSGEDSVPPVSSVALNARTPVLALPPKAAGFRLDAKAMIAWNGSRAAANAMRAALPLLSEMEPVQILSVDHDSEEFPAARAFEYLSHHAIRSDVHWRASEKRTVAETIVELARELECGLIVAGAFGHNRIREMLLGSVTRSLLKTNSLPLLLAH
jgi:nucleotide-binding universal stress UspA family protein